MQASPHRNASTTENRHPLHVIQALLIAGVCMLAGGGIWYLAITGIIGRKKWDFMLYGLKPAILAGCGALVIIGTVLAFFLLPGLKNWSRPVARDLWKDRYRYSLIIPGLIIVFVFSYMPMYGIVLNNICERLAERIESGREAKICGLTITKDRITIEKKKQQIVIDRNNFAGASVSNFAMDHQAQIFLKDQKKPVFKVSLNEPNARLIVPVVNYLMRPEA